MRFQIQNRRLVTVAYYNDGGNSPPPPAPPVVPPPPPPARTFTQEDVDRIVGERTTKLRNESKNYLTELEALRNKDNLTKKEKEDLEERITNLSKEVFTKEELAKQEQDKINKRYKQEQDTLITERDGYKKKYDSLIIRNALIDAAIEHKAYDKDQILDLLAGKSKIVAVLDADGKDTGEITVKIPVRAMKGDKVVELELDAKEALKTMRENPKFYGNLFVADGRGGTGLPPSGGGSGGSGSFNHETGTDEQYFAAREASKKR